jgi:uncharacterized protein (TIGR03435 family)
VASIRPGTRAQGQGGFYPPKNPEHFVTHDTPLRTLILFAYGMETYQLVGPASLETRWDVVANAASGTTKEQFNLMLQRLIEERFHLTFHHVMKEFKGYNLVIAKGGLKLKDPRPDDGPLLPGQIGITTAVAQVTTTLTFSPRGIVGGRNVDMASFAHAISRLFGDTPVIDKTGLTGAYDVRTQFSTGDLPNGRPSDDSSPFPTVFDALPQQLGLKLEPIKAMMEMMVIDHIDAMPTEN